MEVKRYDCNKTADFAHEIKRMCEQYIVDYCYSCPLRSVGCGIDYIDGDMIAAVQKWSDENPEKQPKLTRNEYNFLTGFKKITNRYIQRGALGCNMYIPDMNCRISIADDMFSFIKSDAWSFEELLALEVEE